MTDETDYTRVRFHAQRGDGPDQRGEVTVEVSRNTDDAQPHTVRNEAEREFDEALEHLEDELGV